MFLSVSQSRFKQTGLRKTALTVAVLMLPLVVHAGSSEVAKKAVDKVQPEPSQERMPDARAQNFNFPHWPQHQQQNAEIIPPPPPGPYTSSALSDYSVAAPSPAYRAGRQGARRASNGNAVTPVPMATFSPDIPWPTNLRPEQRQPNHRLSEQGGHHVKPFYGSVPSNNYGNYNYANRSAPYPSDRGMNTSRWMPNMTMTPPGPYNNRLNYMPNYGSYYGPQSHGSRYARPVNNNNGTRSANPASR